MFSELIILKSLNNWFFAGHSEICVRATGAQNYHNTFVNLNKVEHDKSEKVW